MVIVELDSKGRLTLPKRIRKAFGKKVLIIDVGNHVKLIPLPSDPFEVLHGCLKIKKTFRELRQEAEEIAKKETEKRGA